MSTPSNPQPAPNADTQLRVRAQRRQDGAASIIYTPDLIAVLDTSAGPPSAYSIVETGPTGKIDSSFLPTITTVLLETDGTPNTLQTVLNLISGANIALTADAFGGVTIAASGTVSTSFGAITTGDNTGATMTVDTGAMLTYAGTGVVNANEITGVAVTNTPSGAGETLVSTGSSAAQWQAVPSGSGNFLQVLVDFGFDAGNEGDIARTTVTGQVWVTGMSVILCNPFGGATADHSPDDAIVEGLVAYAENLVPGVGFDVVAYAPQNSWGKYLINVTGQ